MKRISIEAVEELETEVPELVEAVESRSKGPIVLVLDDFEGQEKLFFNAVWYGNSHGRRVVIEPEH